MDLFHWIDKGGIYALGVIVASMLGWTSYLDKRKTEHERRFTDDEKRLFDLERSHALLAQSEQNCKNLHAEADERYEAIQETLRDHGESLSVVMDRTERILKSVNGKHK